MRKAVIVVLGERIQCNNTTRRVIQLSLQSIYSNGLLDTALFLPFQELQHLDLSVNDLSDWEKDGGFERLSNLKKLEVLNLGVNHFNNSVLPSLGAITSLKNLTLLLNDIEGSLSEYSGVFTQLSSLEVLDLTANRLTGFNPFQGGGNTSKLKVLNLAQNYFSEGIPPSILSLNSLQALSLRYCSIKDSILGFCNLKNLQELDLSNNFFEGVLPSCFGTLTSLRALDLSKNQLTGSISFPLLSSLKSLQHLALTKNRFQGTIISASSIDPRFQLRYLSLSNCNLNISSDDLLSFLNNHHELRHVDIANANLHGKFPNWLVKNNTRLETLVVGNNSLFGDIHFPFSQLGFLSVIDISNNDIQGHIQTNIGEVLPQLLYLNMSRNRLDGRIPSFFGVRNLQVLDLSHNNLSGVLPESLALNSMFLAQLIVSNNRLHGQISPAFFNLRSMAVFLVNNNQFTGPLPNNKVRFVKLSALDVSANNMSGKIPTWIGNMKELTSLVLGHNSFSGPIPPQLCNSVSLQYMDISQNHLSGSIPSCLMTLSNLRFLHLQGNQLSGSLPEASPQISFSSLFALDLRHNRLSGRIPKWFGSLSELNVLLLKGNKFVGPVPSQLCLLNQIAIMDISHNNLSGSIPSCFSKITFGKTKPYMLGVQVLAYENELWYSVPIYLYTGLLEWIGTGRYDSLLNAYTKQEIVEFMSKSYKGETLVSMSGLDMSSNCFSGNIPVEIGALTSIKALNLSHNQLSGEIPTTLVKLKQLKSFSVAYNNLSGRVPGQLSKFGATNYRGNEHLCGAPLQNPCK